MRCSYLPLVLVFVTLTSSVAVAQQAAPVRRYALVVGANDGGPDREMLRYADDDANAFARVMIEMGGLAERDTLVLLDPDRDAFRGAFDLLEATLAGEAEPTGRRELFFYYSGHSDEEGVLLADGRVDYTEVRARVRELGVDVQVGIFDSCASGSFTRIKGGDRVLPILIDQSSDVRGHAFLTSSAADEVAQESDAIGASFFTHYLVSGLRGGADVSGDGRVTLNEAYLFAFDETLARTEATVGGAQHPAYDIQLVGTGDMVLTDLSTVSATLALPEELAGRFFIRDDAGALVAELYKPAGRRVELGLAPGHYTVRLEVDRALLMAEVELEEAETTELRADELLVQSLEGTSARGGVGLEAESPGYRHLAVNVALVTPLETNTVEEERPVLNNLGLNLGFGSADRLEGVQLAGAGNLVHDDFEGAQLASGVNLGLGAGAGTQLSGGLNYVGGDLTGVQISGGVNIGTAELDGVQIAGGANWATDLEGVQITSINLGRDVDGLQLGAINIATERSRGLQFGAFNYADEADVSIGVIGATRAGGWHPQVWTSDTMLPFVGLRTDANLSFTHVGVGTYPLGDDPALMVGSGFGFKLARFGTVGLELDLSHYYAMFEDASDYAGLSQLRFMARWQPVAWLSVIAGPTYNVYVATGDARGVETPGYISAVSRSSSGSSEVSHWPGFALGLSFF